MIAVAGGLGAALAFAATTLLYARSITLIDPLSVVSWVMAVGLALLVAPLAVAGIPDGLDRRTLGWLAISGAGNIAGLLLEFAAFRTGAVGIVAPIVSTEGALAALASVASGEHLGAGSAAALAVVVAGVVMAAVATGETGPREARLRTALFAVGSAGCFGGSLFATGHVGRSLPLAWAALPPRLVGVAVIAIPLAATARLRLTRRAAPLVALAGACEVGGFAAFVVGARHGLAVSAVLASQFGALAALLGLVLFRERLTRTQIAGVATIAIGVAAVSALRA